MIAHLANPTAELPAHSPFRDWHQARLFAGPLPFTFDYEPATHSIVVIEGVRHTLATGASSGRGPTKYLPRARPVSSRREPILASAFYVENIAYSWKRGVVEPLPVAA